MPVELLLLLLAWAATVSLLIVVPWAVIRLTVGVLEADVGTSGADHEHVQPYQSPDEVPVIGPSHESDDADDPNDAVPATTLVKEETDR